MQEQSPIHISAHLINEIRNLPHLAVSPHLCLTFDGVENALSPSCSFTTSRGFDSFYTCLNALELLYLIVD
jgi:hypothetical protein